MGIIFGLVDTENGLPSPMWVGIVQSVEGLDRVKDGRRNHPFSCLTDCSQTSRLIFCPGTGMYIIASLGLKPLDTD